MAGIGSALYHIERSLGSILSFSFFITKQMKTDLRAGQLNGTLPILYVFLARSGKTIRSVSLITLDAAGVVHSADETPGKNGARRADRIRRQRRRGKDAVLFQHRSFQQRRRNSGFLKFCARLAPGNSLIKSASYLLHAGNFTTVRVFCSPTAPPSSRTIPAFRWPITIRGNGGFFPFGRYAGPIAKFPGRYQPEYAELFRQEPADGFRHRLSLALVRNQPAAGDQVALTMHGSGPHQRTLWLGTMKAVRLGVPELLSL